MAYSESQIVLRRNMSSAWVWELRSGDGHVCNRSEGDFETRADAEADAVQNGQTLEPGADT
jgi:hypothetical protein